MRTFSVIEIRLAVTIIALSGFSVVTAASLLLAQSASPTTDVMTNTTSGEGRGEETVNTTTTAVNNVSNALLGRLFSYGEGEGEDIETDLNPINETYIEVSYSSNRILVPPNATGLINATEIGNFTINIQPNGVSINQGQADIMTEDGASGAGSRRRKCNHHICFAHSYKS